MKRSKEWNDTSENKGGKMKPATVQSIKQWIRNTRSLGSRVDALVRSLLDGRIGGGLIDEKPLMEVKRDVGGCRWENRNAERI